MSGDARERVHELVDAVYRAESRRVLATLIRLLGDFDLAEEALHDAFTAAIESWARDGVPANPRAWLVSTGRFKAIDGMRRRARFDASLGELAERIAANVSDETTPDPDGVDDDRLRLVFTCCHPALPADAQVALTLREVCGLTTEEIARAFLTGAPTVAQRIVRAKAKIRDARIPYQMPSRTDLPDRLDSVLRVVYLVFNEGYSASSGLSLTRHDLCGEAIRLGRLLVELLPEPEAMGLLALMLLHEARRAARTTQDGELVLLDDQDRALWNRNQIEEGAALVSRALSSRSIGPYTLQAAVAAVHAEAPSGAATDWAQIVGLYDVLSRADPSPVVDLNRAAAIAMRDGPAKGLALIDAILARGDLAEYHLAHSARADLCRRLGRIDDARTSYEVALGLTRQEPERRFLERRLRELTNVQPIRPATSADAGAIASLLRDAFVEFEPQYTHEGYRATTPDAADVRRRLQEGPVWVVEQNSRIDGTIAAVLRSDGVYLRGMAVSPSARGSGIAGLLLQRVHDFAASHHQRRLYLSTTPFLLSAIRLYAQHGFVWTDAAPHDLFGTPLFTMEKIIG